MVLYLLLVTMCVSAWTFGTSMVRLWLSNVKECLYRSDPMCVHLFLSCSTLQLHKAHLAHLQLSTIIFVVELRMRMW